MVASWLAWCCARNASTRANCSSSDSGAPAVAGFAMSCCFIRLPSAAPKAARWVSVEMYDKGRLTEDTLVPGVGAAALLAEVAAAALACSVAALAS